MLCPASAAELDNRLVDPLIAAQCTFDLSQLDAITTHFDLVVRPAEEFERGPSAPARQVAGAVETAASNRAIGILDEPPGGQRRLVVIAAAHVRSANIELTDRSQRHLPEVPVEQIDTRTAVRPSQREVLEASDSPVDLERQHGDRGLGRTVAIEDPAMRPQLPDALRQRNRARFTCDHEHAARQELARLRRRRQKSGEVRGNDLQVIDPVQREVVRQVRRIEDPFAADHVQRAAAAEGAKDRRVAEVGYQRADGRVARARRQAKKLRHSFEITQELPVLDRNPLGASGGARRVDDIRQIGRGQDRSRILATTAADRGVIAIEKDHPRSRHRRQPLVDRHHRQQQRRLGILEHAGHTLRGVARIDGNIGTAGLDHRQERDDELQ